MGFKLTKQKSCSSVMSKASSSTAPLTPTSSSEFFQPPVSMPTPGQTVGEKTCFRQLKKWCWESGVSYDDALLQRFACFYNYDVEATKKALQENEDNHLLRLQMRGSLLKQVETCALFPLSGLMTKREGAEICYFRPSRFHPKKQDKSLLIKNLCYVLNDLSTTEEQCRHGVAMLVNMKDFTTDQYDEQVWLELLDVLQGNVIPTRISLFLILNPPTWFGRIWRQLKTNMSPEFFSIVRLVETEDLPEYFPEGYQSYMPNDVVGCWRRKDEMVEDYIDRRLFIDRLKSKKKKAMYRDGLELQLLEVPLDV